MVLGPPWTSKTGLFRRGNRRGGSGYSIPFSLRTRGLKIREFRETAELDPVAATLRGVYSLVKKLHLVPERILLLGHLFAHVTFGVVEGDLGLAIGGQGDADSQSPGLVC